MGKSDHRLFFKGSGPGGSTGVLLIHGLGGTPLELKAVARGLAARGVSVTCCQLPGHCGSVDDLLSTGWADWYEGAERAFNELQARCQTVVVGGLSIGAILALRLAALNPSRVDGVMLLAPTLWYDGWAMPWYSFLLKAVFKLNILKRTRFAERHPYGIKDENIRSLVVSAMFSGNSTEAGLACTPLGALREANLLVRDVERRLPSISTPTLIIHPRHDDVSDLSNAVYLQRHLGGLVELLVLDDSYHIITVDRQRDLVIERSSDFIRFVERPGVARQASLVAAE